MTGRGTCWFDTEHLTPACKSKTAPWVPSSALGRVLRGLSFPYLKMRSAEHTLVFFLEPRTHTAPSGAGDAQQTSNPVSSLTATRLALSSSSDGESLI